MSQSVERQVVLPFAQVVRISFNSMRVRLSRSLITTASLALAIAFVAYIWSGIRDPECGLAARRLRRFKRTSSPAATK